MPTIEKTGARDALRSATHEAHERLHGHPLLSKLADGTIGLDDYRWLLTRWWGFHAAAEAALAAAPLPPRFNLAARSKLAALRQDMRDLGLDDREIDALPLCPGLPALDSEAAAVGAGYVVEGSTMGGRVLAKAVGPLMGGGTHGRRFLLGYGARHGTMWRQFTDLIENVAAEPGACHAMITAAAGTFAAFEVWVA